MSVEDCAAAKNRTVSVYGLQLAYLSFDDNVAEPRLWQVIVLCKE